MKILINYLTKWLELPKEYTSLVEWGVRAALVVLIFIIVAYLARRSRIQRIVEWIDEKVGVIQLTTADRNFFSSTIRAAFWLGGWFVIFYVLKLTALLAAIGASAGVLTTIAAFANKDLLGNVSAGLVMQARGQILPGDSVEVLKISGTLRAIGLNSSEIVGFDGVPYHIPNSKMLNEVLTNFSQAEFRRAEIEFWYDPDESFPEAMEEVLDQVIAQTEHKSEEHKSFYRFGDLTEKGQQIKLYLFLKTEGWAANASNAKRTFLEVLDNSEIQIGVPQILHLYVEEEAEKKSTKKK